MYQYMNEYIHTYVSLFKNLFPSKAVEDLAIFVDNCYGELVEELEPCHVGVDLVAGSLIKNLGGTLAPCGGINTLLLPLL